MLSLIISIISLGITAFQSSENRESHIDSVSDNVIQLEKLDMSPNSFILDILNEVISEKEITNENHLFSLDIDDFEGDTKVYIVQEPDKSVPKNDDLKGYIIFGTDTVVISGKLIKDFSYSKVNQPIVLPRQEYLKNDPLEWTYLIIDDAFARYMGSLGWMWYIKPSQLKEYEVNKYFFTAPIRAKN